MEMPLERKSWSSYVSLDWFLLTWYISTYLVSIFRNLVILRTFTKFIHRSDVSGSHKIFQFFDGKDMIRRSLSCWFRKCLNGIFWKWFKGPTSHFCLVMATDVQQRHWHAADFTVPPYRSRFRWIYTLPESWDWEESNGDTFIRIRTTV